MTNVQLYSQDMRLPLCMLKVTLQKNFGTLVHKMKRSPSVPFLCHSNSVRAIYLCTVSKSLNGPMCRVELIASFAYNWFILCLTIVAMYLGNCTHN